MYGKYPRTIDSKNRVMLPSKLRDNLGSKFYMTIGMENMVELRSQSEFDNFASKLNQQSNFDPKARMLKRLWLGNTQEIETDSQGRFVIPKQFLDKAAIQKDVIFVGMGNLVELWSLEKLTAYDEEISVEEMNAAAMHLADKDF